MEPIELFAMAVLAVCLLHLASSAGTRLKPWWRRIVHGQGSASATGMPRSDWYAFFHCADLIGPDPKPDRKPARAPRTAAGPRIDRLTADKRRRVTV